MRMRFTAQCRYCGLILFFVGIAGCGDSAPQTAAPTGRMVYVDTATMQPLVHDVSTSFPAIHPKTGKPTLRPALYCPTCKKWSPAPDLDQINRVPGSGLCSKDKTPLTAEGPWPEDSAVAQGAAK